MKLMVRERDNESWRDVGGAYRALLGAVARRLQVLIRSANPDDELGEIVSAIRLIRRAGGDPAQIRVDGAYASAVWVESVRAAGARHLGVRDSATLDLPHGVCPALRVRRCSNRYEDGDLGEEDLTERCMSKWRSCPRYEAAAVLTCT